MTLSASISQAGIHFLAARGRKENLTANLLGLFIQFNLDGYGIGSNFISETLRTVLTPGGPSMPKLQFNQKDIEALTRKVGTLAPYLSEPELALLLAIFAVASQRVERRNRAATLPAADTVHPAQGAVTGRQATFEDLQRQLLDAYVAGTDPSQGGFRASITGTPPTGVPPTGAAPTGIPTQDKNE